MTKEPVTDIDILRNKVRDRNSQILIDEAITAYRGGALRSAIVSTWVAVLYDIISKARELAHLDELACKKFIQDLDNAVKNNTIQKLLKIEREIISWAKDEVEVISPHEHEALNRIRIDRNRCAHLSLCTEDQVFQPLPELVKVHILHALEHSLIHAPLQGKSAIEGFFKDIQSKSFPSSEREAREFFFSKYLNRTKEASIENMIKKILTIFFFESGNKIFEHRLKLSWALSEISDKRKDIFINTTQQYLKFKSDIKGEKNLLSICLILGSNSQIWNWLSNPIRLALLELIRNCTAEDMIEHYVPHAHDISDIGSHIRTKMRRFRYQDQVEIINRFPNKHFVPMAIYIYRRSKNQKMASDIGHYAIMKLAVHFNSKDIISVLDAVKSNDNIYKSKSIEMVLMIVFSSTKNYLPHTKESWIKLIEDPKTPDFPILRRRLNLRD